ncbi:hypothetical protein FOZ62_016376, partial [Perkinsus olseni]
MTTVLLAIIVVCSCSLPSYADCVETECVNGRWELMPSWVSSTNPPFPAPIEALDFDQDTQGYCSVTLFFPKADLQLDTYPPSDAEGLKYLAHDTLESFGYNPVYK